MRRDQDLSVVAGDGFSGDPGDFGIDGMSAQKCAGLPQALRTQSMDLEGIDANHL